MTAPLVGGGKDDVRVARVEDDVADAGVLADREDGSPGRAAVGRLVESAFAALREERPLRCHVDDARVARVDENLADVFGGFEPHPLPGLAGVGRFVDAVAEVSTALAVVFPRAQPEDVRVFRIDRDAAEREHPVVVEDGRERDAAVGCLPHSAERRDDVPDTGVFRIDLDVDDAARGQGRTDAAKRQTLQDGGRHGGLVLAGAEPCRHQTDSHQDHQGSARHVINSGRLLEGLEGLHSVIADVTPATAPSGVALVR